MTEYQLVGGQPVKISPVEITENGTTYAPEGCAFNPVTTGVAPTAKELEAPYPANDGHYFFAATGAEDATEAAICIIEDGAISESYGTGSVAIDDSGDEPVLSWIPVMEEPTITCWYGV